MNREEIRQALSGPVSSVRVPFQREGSIDFKGLRDSIEFNIAAGSSTMLLTYGDSLLSILTDDEVAEVTKAVVEYTRRRAMVVAADRMWWTGKTVEFAKFAREAGADVLMTLPPDWGHSCTAESSSDHYAAVAEQMPVMVVTAAFLARPLDFTLEVLKLTLQKAPGVVALKDDICGGAGRRIASLAHGQCAFVSGGQKQNHLDVWPYGADGYLSTFVTFRPEIAHQYWNAILAENKAAAAGIVRDYEMPFFDFIVRMPGKFDAAIHGALELHGIAGRWRRAPYHSLSDSEMEQLAHCLRVLKLL